MGLKRTHTCNELRVPDVGELTVLSGWVNSARDLGGLVFIDLRDREGITQLVINPPDHPTLMDTVRNIREEWVLSVKGQVRRRPGNMVNPDLGTGEIEVEVQELEVESKSKPVPFHLDDPAVSEDLRLTYRYLDMRRSGLARNLRLRHKLTKTVRDYFDSEGFVEVETPILSKSTPEGARDFLIPSRVSPGKFFALPQAPQQYKQLLMVGGIEKYFQIARCFRDEDLRADRQPEFTQIDVEMSFVDAADIIACVEGMLTTVMKVVKGIDIATPLPRLTYDEAMGRFGSDKPDLRFAMELTDLTTALADTQFRVFQSVIAGGGIIKALNAPRQGDASKRRIDQWTETAKLYGAKGLVSLKVEDSGALKGAIAKFLSQDEERAIVTACGASAGDLVLMVAADAAVANGALGRLRTDIASEVGIIPKDDVALVWIVDFPLLQREADTGRFTAMHHPFTSPKDDDVPLLQTDPEAVRAKAYDIVMNGIELGGGSIRIHRPDVQEQMFAVLGIERDEAHRRFGHLLDALSFGAPPHGGIALGLDRFAMLLAGAQTIRDVIAFPKTTRASCLMTDSPSEVDPGQLSDLGIQLTSPKGTERALPAHSVGVPDV